MLSSKLRIKNGKEYNNIYKNGKKINGRYMFAYFSPNNLTYSRFGIVTSKKVGKAVARNKVKRRIRAIILRNINNFSGHCDIVIVVKYNNYPENFNFLEEDFLVIMGKAGLC